MRTLDIFLTTLLAETSGQLPNNFVVMLPKVTIPEQMTTLVRLFELLESANGLPPGTLKMETMVEATQIIMDEEGRNPLLRIIRASEGRCIAAHFGTYDYTASCGITARYQTMGHPVCDFAHHMTKVALGGTGIFLSDGATNVMPIGPHRGENLTFAQLRENRESVHNAWRQAYHHSTHSLINGFYQGWDLNPAQLPMRYAATYTFFLSSYDDAVFRLKTFVERAAISTLTGDIFDDAATGQGPAQLLPQSPELRRDFGRGDSGDGPHAGRGADPLVLPDFGGAAREDGEVSCHCEEARRSNPSCSQRPTLKCDKPRY